MLLGIIDASSAGSNALRWGVASQKLVDDNYEVNVGVMMVRGEKNPIYMDAENSSVKIKLPESTLANNIGLTANKIKAGETILGITGTYTGENDTSL